MRAWQAVLLGTAACVAAELSSSTAPADFVQCCDLTDPSSSSAPAEAPSSSSPTRSQRWAVVGEPFQRRLVSLVPGTWPPNSPPLPAAPWSPAVPELWPPNPPPWSPAAVSGLWPPNPPLQPAAPWSPSMSGLWPPSSPPQPAPYPWPPIQPYLTEPWGAPPVEQPQQPPWLSLPPPAVWPPYGNPAAPLVVQTGPQEQASKDLDIGVYAGNNAPGRVSWPAVMEAPGSSRDLDVGVFAGDEPQPPAISPPYPGPSWYQTPSPWPQYPAPSPGVWRTPYPWLREQGGFNVRPAEKDVKLTMHVPRDGLPGGVIVMEMKASIYRPVY